MSFLKGLFSSDHWVDFDPDRSFRDKIITVVGLVEFAKLDGIMRLYKALETEFFQSGKFSRCPDRQKLTYFVDFLDSWIDSLSANGLAKDAQLAAKVRDKLKFCGAIEDLPLWYKFLPVTPATGAKEGH